MDRRKDAWREEWKSWKIIHLISCLTNNKAKEYESIHSNWKKERWKLQVRERSMVWILSFFFGSQFFLSTLSYPIPPNKTYSYYPLWSQVRVLWLLIWWPLKDYMVINFRARGISRGARKLARTPTLN
jgi:hypothetical protein